jgi:hypothetical protein
MSTPSVWCPACGAEYTAGSRYCNECRVELVVEPPAGNGERGDELGDATALVVLGEFPRLHAQILRRRLETAGLSVMVEWSGPGGSALGTILVPDAQAEFAEAVINEIEVDDEVPDSSPEAYIARIEEHLSAVGALLDELRTRLEQPET